MLIEELKNINSSEHELKKFGISVGAVFIIIGFIFQYIAGSYYIYVTVGTIGAVLLLCGVVFPEVLLPVHKLWMSLAVILGFIMTRVIITILFYLVVTPIALVAKVFRKDFLDLKMDKSRETYWQRRKEDYQKEFTERQF